MRTGLAGQLRQQRLSTAAVLYGPLGSMTELRARIAHALPWRLGAVRLARPEPIESTETPIPDDVLLKYDDALQLGLFARFMVARAAYNWTSQPHAWLVAEIAGTERWVVVATWQETPSAHAA